MRRVVFSPAIRRLIAAVTWPTVIAVVVDPRLVLKLSKLARMSVSTFRSTDWPSCLPTMDAMSGVD